jgi:hypothetical protein
MFPDVPQSLDDLYKEMTTDCPFTDQYGRDEEGGPPGHRAVVFTSSTMLNILSAAAWLFLDGTFAVRPSCPPSRQMLVISALHLGCVSTLYYFRGRVRLEHFFIRVFLQLVPVCFVLMESKHSTAYHHLFALLKDLVPGLSPQHIVTDFEAALVEPIAEMFPGTKHQGCWFHYCQVSIIRIGKGAGRGARHKVM